MPIWKNTLDIDGAKRANLPLVMRQNGIRLKKAGNGLWKTHCLWHSEKSPSLVVYSDHFYCFGCAKTGNAIDFLMEQAGLTFIQAVRELSSKSVPRVELPIRREAVVAKQRKVVSPDLIDFWHKELLKRPERMQYLYSRMFTDETIVREKWGWRDGYFVLPVWDWKPQLSDILSVRFRAGDNQEPRYMGMEGYNESALYNKQAIIGQKEVYIFFGELDAMLACQDGLAASSPTNGKGSFDKSWLDYFQSAERIWVVPDKDSTEKLIPRVHRPSLKIKATYSQVKTEMASGLEVCEMLGRRAKLYHWKDDWRGKDFNGGRIAGNTLLDFTGG